MAVTFEQVAKDIRSLPRHQKDRLLSMLIQDLDGEPDLAAQELREAWSQEVSKRLEDIDAGRVKPVPADKAFASLRRKRSDAG